MSGPVRAESELARLLEAERRAHRELEVAHRRASFLADAGFLLERSLELEESMATVAELVLHERVADVVAIDIVEPGGALRRVTERLRVLDGDTARATVDLVQPLVAGGRTRGALSLGWYPGDEPALAGPESRLILELAGRLAMAIDNAQLFEERAHVARTLQASLLPPVLPAVPGLRVASRYVAGSATLDVGGDFYDLFASAPGTWNVIVGDVCGKGAEAAAMTAMTRYTLRALADRRTDPADLLSGLNDALLREYEELRFVTAVLGRLRPRRGSVRLDVACAGHPPPLLARADGAREAVRTSGPLLGVRTDPDYAAVHVDLRPGDVVVLHTDGLTEARRPSPLRAGDLLELIAAHRAEGPDAVATALLARAHEVQGPAPPDDLALIALSPTEPA